MKHAKKLLAALLALAMMLAMAVPAFAATTGTFGTTTGTITINNAVNGQTYKIYRIFDLESFDDGNNAYSYKLNTAWNGFKDYTKDGVSASQFFTIENGYIKWVADADAAAFAKLAKAFIAEKNITKTDETTADASGAQFTNMDLGYYLVDTSLGTLLSLNTSKPNATIDEKNVAPTIDKVVSANGTNYSASSDAQIGDTVYYKVTIHAKKGAEGYVLNDTMSEGLTFNNDIVIKNGANNLTAGTDYTVKTGEDAKPYTFVVEFAQNYLDGLTDNADLEVTYTATLNEKAQVSTASTNKAELKYGENHNTVKQETTTNTYKFDLVKIDGRSRKLIDGALFELYKDQNCTQQVKFTKSADEKTYKVSTAEGAIGTIAVKDGKVTIEGLDKKVYYLKETQAPSGYNTLTGYVDVNVSEDTVRANVTTTTSADGTFYTTGGKPIENNKGTTLPSTGGIGTTIFYVIGGGLMVAAAVLLITKKRMENKDN